MKQKTKKIILLISTILTLVISLGYIYAISTNKLDLGTIEGTTELSNSSQLIFLSICALVNILGIFLISKDIIKYKKKIIILNVIQILFGTLFNILCGIINIIIITGKTKDVEEKPKEKKLLPKLEDITKYKWYVYFIIFIVLFALTYTPITSLLPIPETLIAAIITTTAIYVIQILGLVIPMYNELKRDFIIFIKNFKLYLRNMLPRFGFIVLLYFICSTLVLLIVGDIPNNQESLLSLPLYLTAFLAIFIAPLTEELMFRGFIKKFIKNDILFVILSSLIFGGLHVLSADSLLQLLYIIPYSVIGLAFSLNYVKTKNIASNIFLHCAWNTMATLLIIVSSI